MLLGSGLLKTRPTHAEHVRIASSEMKAMSSQKIIKFSIHEHHRPLLSSYQTERIGILGKLLDYLQEDLDVQFEPVWRQGPNTGREELETGIVDLIVDPPRELSAAAPKELVIPVIFQSQGVLVKSPLSKHENRQGQRIAYLLGIGDFSKIHDSRKDQTWIGHNSIEDIYRSFMENRIDSAVLPLRLFEYQISNGLNLQWENLYGNEPIHYSWVFNSSQVELKNILEEKIKAWQKLHTLSAMPGLGVNLQQSLHPLIKKWGFPCVAILCALTFLLITWIYRLRQERLKIIAQSTQLAASKQQALQANRAKSNFLATVSHEIRTPMHAILGVQELLLQSKTIHVADQKLLQSAQNAAKSLLEILNQVLDISKYEAGKLQIKERPTDVRGLIQCTMQTFQSLAQKQNIICQISIDDQLANSLLVDDLRLRQVLQNLLSNAIKFTQEGYVSISCKVLNNTHAEQWLEFNIADTGIGIAHSEIDRLLKPYEQSKINDLSSLPGTGLGLSITSELLKSLQSELILESQEGFGTTACFSLHLKRSTAKPPRFNLGPLIDHYPTRIRPIKSKSQTVLIVDDHEASREVLRIQIEQLGYDVLLAEDGFEALKKVHTHQPHIILTDENMPGLSGRELAKRLRESYPKLRIIGITANIFAQENQASYLNAGMDRVLVKPINLNELHLCLADLGGDLVQTPQYRTWQVNELIKFTSDDTTLQSKIVRSILELQQAFLKVLNQVHTTEQELSSWAHKIRGGAKLIGALNVENHCLQIEKQLPVDQIKDSSSFKENQIKSLITALLITNQELEDFLSSLQSQHSD